MINLQPGFPYVWPARSPGPLCYALWCFCCHHHRSVQTIMAAMVHDVGTGDCFFQYHCGMFTTMTFILTASTVTTLEKHSTIIWHLFMIDVCLVGFRRSLPRVPYWQRLASALDKAFATGDCQWAARLPNKTTYHAMQRFHTFLLFGVLRYNLSS